VLEQLYEKRLPLVYTSQLGVELLADTYENENHEGEGRRLHAVIADQKGAIDLLASKTQVAKLERAAKKAGTEYQLKHEALVAAIHIVEKVFQCAGLTPPDLSLANDVQLKENLEQSESRLISKLKSQNELSCEWESTAKFALASMEAMHIQNNLRLEKLKQALSKNKQEAKENDEYEKEVKAKLQSTKHRHIVQTERKPEQVTAIAEIVHESM
jgi:hypothetical protein